MSVETTSTYTCDTCKKEIQGDHPLSSQVGRKSWPMNPLYHYCSWECLVRHANDLALEDTNA